jgi:hypothetical protein
MRFGDSGDGTSGGLGVVTGCILHMVVVAVLLDCITVQIFSCIAAGLLLWLLVRAISRDTLVDLLLQTQAPSNYCQ